MKARVGCLASTETKFSEIYQLTFTSVENLKVSRILEIPRITVAPVSVFHTATPVVLCTLRCLKLLVSILSVDMPCLFPASAVRNKNKLKLKTF